MNKQTSKLQDLRLINFRNHLDLYLSIEEKSFIIAGTNGSGKTSILEGISLLSPGRGLKNSPWNFLINHNANQADIIANINNNQLGASKLQLHISPNTEGTYKKNYLIDDELQNNSKQISQHFNSIWLTPQMDNFFIQDNSFKRKFVDRMIFIINKHHITLLNTHEKLIRERNKILQQQENKPIPKHVSLWLDQIEEELIQIAVSIVTNRQNFCHSINTLLKQHLLYPAEIYMDGEIEELLNLHKYALPVERILLSKLQNTRNHIYKTEHSDNNNYKPKTTFTNIGAHKSQLKTLDLNTNTAAEICSTGEQKMLLISITTAFAELSLSKNSIPPCLLLDEINVHLDQKNLEYTINRFLDLNLQIFITTTNPELFDNVSSQFEYKYL